MVITTQERILRSIVVMVQRKIYVCKYLGMVWAGKDNEISDGSWEWREIEWLFLSFNRKHCVNWLILAKAQRISQFLSYTISSERPYHTLPSFF